MAVAYNASVLLQLPAQIEEAEKSVAQQKYVVADVATELSREETDVMLAAIADGKDAEARKMQREAAASHNDEVDQWRKSLRKQQQDLAIFTAKRDRLIREYDALLALVKAG